MGPVDRRRGLSVTIRDKAALRAANVRLALVLGGIAAVFFIGAMVQHMWAG